ncbi:AEC family transporter [Pontibacillus salicampi]|uniref:AEC family transporter n=1 Tax=Pontibacillus salicampi TaxID=1449801 RepID=A0ABV6LQM6_9BACI
MDVIVVVLPAFLIFSIGFIGQKVIGFDRKTISKAALYLMYPFLAFQTFYNNTITIDFLYIILFCITLMVLLILLVKLLTWYKNTPRPKASAMVLSSVFMNAGNYGVPIILFAYGEQGATYAIIMMVIQSLLMNTVGLYYASLGSADENARIGDSVKKVLTMPINHAVILGVCSQIFQITVPPYIMQSVNLIADATIPTIMLVLGMQLATLSKGTVQVKDIITIGTIKMVVSPVLAFLITAVLGLNSMLSGILIVLAAMPTAANTTMYSIQYNTEPQLVSYSTFWTTLWSVITIPFLLWMVGAV